MVVVLYETVARWQTKFAFGYSFNGDRSRVFSKRLHSARPCSSRPAVLSNSKTFLRRNQAESKQASKQCRPCSHVRNAMICADM